MRWLGGILLIAACGSKDPPTPPPSASTSENADASDAPTPKPPPARKKLRGAWGTLEVDGAFRPGASMIPLPQGMTADVEYVRYTESGAAVGRLVIAHQDVPGLGATPAPRYEDAGGDQLAAVVCPGGTMDTAMIEIADGSQARIQCTRSAFGPGVVAMARKKIRAYELICADESDPRACFEIVKTFSPAAPP